MGTDIGKDFLKEKKGQGQKGTTYITQQEDRLEEGSGGDNK